VLAMLLLPPAAGYGVAGVAAILMISGLWISKQLSPDQSSVLLILGWTAALMLTAFVTHHITARLRRQESHGRDQQSRLHAILDTAADGIITINERGIIQSANPAAASIFGYDVEELLGRNVNILMPEPDHSQHDEYVRNYLRTGHAKIIGIGREVLGKKKTARSFRLNWRSAKSRPTARRAGGSSPASCATSRSARQRKMNCEPRTIHSSANRRRWCRAKRWLRWARWRRASRTRSPIRWRAWTASCNSPIAAGRWDGKAQFPSSHCASRLIASTGSSAN
jgi:PAS domain S-box-containing protein